MFQGCVVDGQTFARDRQRQSAARNSTRNLDKIAKQHYGGREFHSTTMHPALSIHFPSPRSINLQLSTSLSTLHSFKRIVDYYHHLKLIISTSSSCFFLIQ